MASRWIRRPWRVLGWSGWVAVALVSAVWLTWGPEPSNLSARDKGDASKEAALPADLDRIPRDAAGLLSIRVGDFWSSEMIKGARARLLKEVPDARKQMERDMGTAPDQIERLTFVLLEAGPGIEPVMVVATFKAYDVKQVLKALGSNPREEKYKDQVLHVAENNRKALYPLSDRVFLLGPTGSVKAFLDRPAKKEGPLGAALIAASKKHLEVIGVNVQAMTRALPDMLLPAVTPFKPLLKAHAATLVFNLGVEAQADLRVVFGNETDAREGIKSVKTALSLAQKGVADGIRQMSKDKDWEGTVKLFKQVETALNSTSIEQKGATLQAAVTMKINAETVGVTLMDAVQEVRNAAARAASSNNLKQLALAMHGYHDTYGNFPPAAIYDKDGKPGLSWRVQLLPYIEQAALYKEFHLDEAWDSAHNKKLLTRMPRVFAAPNGKVPTTATPYLAFVGKGTIFDGKKGIPIAGITDGTSNTIMFVESARSIPWTKPEDLPFDPTRPLPKLGLQAKVFMAAFCDGSVRSISTSIKPEKLHALITVAGGEVISDD